MSAAASTSGMLLDDQAGPVRTLTLNRPGRLNALDTGLRQAIADALIAAQRDDSVRAVIVAGAGPRAFCAGQDLHEGSSLTADDAARWMASWKGYFEALSSFTKPLIAAINGVAAGAGFQTALLCDYRVAVPQSRFIMAEIDAGLPCIVGCYLLTVHLGLSRATEIVLSGRTIGASEAREMGLIHEIVEPDDLAARAYAAAERLAGKPPVAMRLDLERFRSRLRDGLVEAEDAAARYQAEAVATGEPQRVMAAFLDKHGRRQTG